MEAINRDLIAKAESVDSPQRVVLDMDSTETPVYGQQENSAGHQVRHPRGASGLSICMHYRGHTSRTRKRDRECWIGKCNEPNY